MFIIYNMASHFPQNFASKVVVETYSVDTWVGVGDSYMKGTGMFPPPPLPAKIISMV